MKYAMMVLTVAALALICLTSISAQVITQKGNGHVVTQGGDNINDAFPIPDIPFSDSGTTVGYADDYHGCGVYNYAPDVVYSYYAAEYMVVMASLCYGSDFDTWLYVFEDNPNNIVACNDDYCGLVSQITCMEMTAGHTYYFVIDGYGTESGNYMFLLTLLPPGLSLSGNVTEFMGGPISGAEVRVLQNGSEVWHDTTFADGSYYAVYLPPGSYTAEASKRDYIPQSSDPFDVGTCLFPQVDFVLIHESPPPIGAIAGTVNDSFMNEPLEGVFVSAHQDGTEMTWYDTTDASGEFLFPECQTQSHTVEASMLGYITQTRFNVEVFADETTDVDFALAAAPPRCVYTPGDINGATGVNGLDIVFAVDYFKGRSIPPDECHSYCPNTPNPFYAAGDVNGNCAFNGIDITFFVRYLKLQVPSLLYCADCPPAGMAPPVPTVEPIKAPMLKSSRSNGSTRTD